MLETNDVKWGSGFFLSVSRIALKTRAEWDYLWGAESGQRKMRSNMDRSSWGCRKKQIQKKFPHGPQGSWALTQNAVQSSILNFIKRDSKEKESRNIHTFQNVTDSLQLMSIVEPPHHSCNLSWL
uniref:Uncharacterized protein n=1 Tax=Micrurus paraensis TaxID=1970185 RepID=A0A2D4K9B7_9SAUR